MEWPRAFCLLVTLQKSWLSVFSNIKSLNLKSLNLYHFILNHTVTVTTWFITMPLPWQPEPSPCHYHDNVTHDDDLELHPLKPIYTRRFSDGISCGIAHLSNKRTFIYFCVTPERYRTRSLRERFPDGKPPPDMLVTNQCFCFDCSHATDAQTYVGQGLRRLDQNRSGEYRFSESVYWLRLNFIVVWLNSVTFSIDRIIYANVRKLRLWNCDIFEKPVIIHSDNSRTSVQNSPTSLRF